jgi:hypothetical protein
MKRRIQQERLEEYHSRRNEFGSYAEFIVARANASAKVRAWREKGKRAIASRG